MVVAEGGGRGVGVCVCANNCAHQCVSVCVCVCVCVCRWSSCDTGSVVCVGGVQTVVT